MKREIILLIILLNLSATFGYTQISNDVRFDKFKKSLHQPGFDGRNFEKDSPVFPDGGLTEMAKLFANDASRNDSFGYSVAFSGDWAVIGAPDNDFPDNIDAGAAYIFSRIDGVWTFIQRLTAPDFAGGDQFGGSVSISGDTAIVGAEGKNDGFGAAYIFTRSGNNWTQQAKLTIADGSRNDFFGGGVSITGDTALIGMPGEDTDSFLDHGSVYVFTRNGNIWTHRQKLLLSTLQFGMAFGTKIAVSGDTAIFSANGESVSNNFSSGAAYIFIRNGENWILQQKIVPNDPGQSARFGWSVAIDGDRAIAGAINANVDGAAYIFSRTNGVWTQEIKILSPRQTSGQEFGYAVDINGDTAFVSDRADNSFKGLVYEFTGNGTNWSEQQRFTANDSLSGDQFGYSIALTADTLFIGAIVGDIASLTNVGTAYVFTRMLNRRMNFDFDGDGKSDVSVYRPSNGAWYINQSANGFTGIVFGVSTDLNAPADFDGDGKTDFAVFRPVNGAWYYLRSSDGAFVGVTFGQSGDLPRPADFDGDGKADINVFRPSNGAWYRLNSSNNSFSGMAFGQNGDKPLNADFDGDGKNDVAVFRPSTGSFYLLDSSTGAFRGVAFGFGTDIPTPFDFDGDGKTDIAVFRPSNGAWYLLQSSNGAFATQTFGTTTDKPVPAAFIQ